jgi:hypothetical protein
MDPCLKYHWSAALMIDRVAVLLYLSPMAPDQQRRMLCPYLTRLPLIYARKTSLISIPCAVLRKLTRELKMCVVGLTKSKEAIVYTAKQSLARLHATLLSRQQYRSRKRCLHPLARQSQRVSPSRAQPQQYLSSSTRSSRLAYLVQMTMKMKTSRLVSQPAQKLASASVPASVASYFLGSLSGSASSPANADRKGGQKHR